MYQGSNLSRTGQLALNNDPPSQVQNQLRLLKQKMNNRDTWQQSKPAEQYTDSLDSYKQKQVPFSQPLVYKPPQLSPPVPRSEFDFYQKPSHGRQEPTKQVSSQPAISNDYRQMNFQQQQQYKQSNNQYNSNYPPQQLPGNNNQNGYSNLNNIPSAYANLNSYGNMMNYGNKNTNNMDSYGAKQTVLTNQQQLNQQFFNKFNDQQAQFAKQSFTNQYQPSKQELPSQKLGNNQPNYSSNANANNYYASKHINNIYANNHYNQNNQNPFSNNSGLGLNNYNDRNASSNGYNGYNDNSPHLYDNIRTNNNTNNNPFQVNTKMQDPFSTFDEQSRNKPQQSSLHRPQQSYSQPSQPSYNKPQQQYQEPEYQQPTYQKQQPTQMKQQPTQYPQPAYSQPTQPSYQQSKPQKAFSNPLDELPAVASKAPNNQPFEDEDDDGDLEECPEGCGRNFRPKALVKHVKVCKKVFQSKRKQFNSKAARQVDNEQLKLEKQGKAKDKIIEQRKKVGGEPKWKKQSEQFRQMISANKGGAEPVQVVDDDLVECPACGRKFNEIAADRHIPGCKKRNKMR